MKPYTKTLTARPSARGTVQIFPQTGSLPPPPRPTQLTSIALFHLNHDVTKLPSTGGKS